MTTGKRNTKRNILLVAGISLVLVIGLVSGFGIHFIQQNNTKMAAYIRTHPEISSVVVYSFDDEGNLIDQSTNRFMNADTPLQTGSVMKLMVLAAYATAVSEGLLDPNELIPVSTVERFYLPYTDGQSHQAGLASLGIAVDQHGYAKDQNASITLDDIARTMIHYSANAGTDYLITRLGPERIQSVLNQTGMTNHSPISTVLGKTLMMFNHEGSNEDEDAGKLEDLFLNDPSWRNEQIDFILSGKVHTTLQEQYDWMEKLGWRGTAREYASLMSRIAAGRLISPQVSAMMQTILENMPSNGPLDILYYDRLGSKDGVTPGVLAVASYMRPIRGRFAGQNRVVVVFLNQMPLDYWRECVQAETIYLYSALLAEGSDI